MKIYLDLLLIQDTIMMSLILFAMCKVLNTKINVMRIIIISLMSEIISILLLIFIPTIYDNSLIKFLISYIVVKFLFKEKKTSIIQKTLMFWTIVFLIGGTSLFLNNNIFLTIIAILISTTVIITNRQKIKKQLYLECATCVIEFEYKNIEYKLKALIDTGHDVKTIYNESVIFVKNILLEEGGEYKERLVSYKTISGMENRIGIRINDIKILYNENKISSSAVIVSTPNILQNYDAIIGYDLIGGMTDGNTIVDETKSKEIVC